mmetsp:Transcript_120058/g.188335  ORF Transcript_120058/g.188335 Transcript_120058/m.188335 type:complete len:201 (-) Transcript_120058:657-1259(-)
MSCLLRRMAQKTWTWLAHCPHLQHISPVFASTCRWPSWRLHLRDAANSRHQEVLLDFAIQEVTRRKKRGRLQKRACNFRAHSLCLHCDQARGEQHWTRLRHLALRKRLQAPMLGQRKKAPICSSLTSRVFQKCESLGNSTWDSLSLPSERKPKRQTPKIWKRPMMCVSIKGNRAGYSCSSLTSTHLTKNIVSRNRITSRR